MLQRLTGSTRVERLIDLTKEELVEKFKELDQYASKTKSDEDRLGFFCITIGFNVTLDQNPRLFDKLKVPHDGDSAHMTQHYLVTVDGEPINILEYITRLANQNVPCIYLVNYDYAMYM